MTPAGAEFRRSADTGSCMQTQIHDPPYDPDRTQARFRSLRLLPHGSGTPRPAPHTPSRSARGIPASPDSFSAA